MGKILEGLPDSTGPLLQLAEPFIPLYKEEQANQREIKVRVPQRTLREGEGPGGWQQDQAEAERKPHRTNKDESQQIPRIRRGDTWTRRDQAMWDSSLSGKEEGLKKDKKLV